MKANDPELPQLYSKFQHLYVAVPALCLAQPQAFVHKLVLVGSCIITMLCEQPKTSKKFKTENRRLATKGYRSLMRKRQKNQYCYLEIITHETTKNITQESWRGKCFQNRIPVCTTLFALPIKFCNFFVQIILFIQGARIADSVQYGVHTNLAAWTYCKWVSHQYWSFHCV